MANTLAAFQRHFAGFLLQETMEPPPALDTWLGSNRATNSVESNRVDAGLRVYRNNVIYSLSQALAAQFPVVQKLVGPEFFGALACDYVRQVPPLEPSLTWYGDQFAGFIAAHPACQPLTYLADVATLELHCQRALHAADDSVLDLEQFAAMPPQQFGETLLSLHPSACLFTSNYPVDRIWVANLEDSPERIQLDLQNLHHMLIYRRELEVQVVSLQPAAYVLLQQLDLGSSLLHACSQVQKEHRLDDTELAPLLGYLLGLGVFSRFSLQRDKEFS